MKKQVVIIGAGGHCKVVADVIHSSGATVIGCLDDDSNKCSCGGIPVIGTVGDAEKFKAYSFVIAIGTNSVRKKIAEKMPWANWYTAIDASAVVSSSAVIGEGTVVMPNAVVNAEAVVGRHCIINTAAVIEHENRIGDYVHISPRAALAGNVVVGEMTHIGIGACVRNNINILSGCTIGAGAVVVKDIVQNGIYIGVPARKM